jgi:hypothetical protein
VAKARELIDGRRSAGIWPSGPLSAMRRFEGVDAVNTFRVSAGTFTYFRVVSHRQNPAFPQVIPEGAGPVKTNLCVVWFVLRASLSWLGASK